MEENCIEVKNISKSFTVASISQKNAKSGLSQKKSSENRLVIDNISFNIKRGETVGLLGKNGSGKSTILKMLSSVMHPDSGEIKINGNVTSILELGMGFHADLSGRENIYIKGSMYGLSKKDIDDIIDRIIDFSELEDRIDDPIRIYSSGMHARLAFAIAINMKSEILIIDEVLSVGDAGFRAKCAIALKDLIKKNVTVLIASHSLSLIEDMCNRAIWIESGKVIEIGESDIVCYHYEKNMTESFDAIKRSAEYGDMTSQNTLAIMYRDGRNVPVNLEEAIKWFKKAAESGLAVAQVNLGELILQTNDTETGREEAERWFKLAAESRNVDGQIRVAELSIGDEWKKEWNWTVEIATELSNNGNIRTQSILAGIYLNGVGTPRDEKTALKWYLEAARGGDFASQFQVGMMYRDGIGTDKDSKKAIEWLSLSGRNGHIRAKTELALMFRRGIGVDRDIPASLEWYKDAASYGDANSMYQLAIIYRDGIGVDKNMEIANKWFKDYSKQNRMRLQGMIGDTCRHGVDMNTILAAELYEKCAIEGHIASKHSLGLLKAEDVSSDPFEIAELYKDAAIHGHVRAQMDYGNMLLKGNGVERNPEEAFKFLKKASDVGNHLAKYQLGLMYRDGIGTKVDREEAMNLFRFAASFNHKDAFLAFLKLRESIS